MEDKEKEGRKGGGKSSIASPSPFLLHHTPLFPTLFRLPYFVSICSTHPASPFSPPSRPTKLIFPTFPPNQPHLPHLLLLYFLRHLLPPPPQLVSPCSVLECHAPYNNPHPRHLSTDLEHPNLAICTEHSPPPYS
ncbi:hypothetical protein Pcinc_040427 [Petrolisthes cinctipes]|uniref:Uncharacterized protein n=1 Tax=Petrolisthes cinctipes TaxID=88211 RepID=A0AAE1BLL7_PETCI|nr:hypothetical protein Pcinc_040427 [Petrolisthes cinctipes]